MSQSMEEKTKELAENPIVRDLFFFTGTSLPSPRSDWHCMVTPIFAMRAGNMKVVEFHDGKGGTIKVTPAKDGRATIEDRDLLLFALSIMNYDSEYKPENWQQPRTIRFRLVDFFRFCGQESSPSSQQIKGVENALKRLRGTTIETNLTYNGKEITTEFSLISSWTVTKKEHRQRGRGHAVKVEIELCRWLHNAVVPKREILTINPLYFRLPALQRRLYEIARKCVGIDPRKNHPITFTSDKLLAMLGTDRPKKKVMADLRAIQKSQPIPDFHFEVTVEHVRMSKKPKETSSEKQVEHVYDDSDDTDNNLAGEHSRAIVDEVSFDDEPFDLQHVEDLYPNGISGQSFNEPHNFDIPDPNDY